MKRVIVRAGLVLLGVWLIGAILIGSVIATQSVVVDESEQISKVQPVVVPVISPDTIEYAQDVAEYNKIQSEANLNNGISNAAEDVGSAVEVFAFTALFQQITGVFIAIFFVGGILWLLYRATK